MANGYSFENGASFLWAAFTVEDVLRDLDVSERDQRKAVAATDLGELDVPFSV